MEDCMSSKFAMCVYFDQHYKQTKDLVEPINRTYCNKHGIEYINSYAGLNLPPEGKYKDYYAKFLLAYDTLFSKNFDYVFMLDADAVVLDHSLDIRKFVSMTDNEIMICAAEDVLENIWWDVNTGAIIFKNDNKVKTFLDSYFKGAEVNEYSLNDQDLFQFMLKSKMTSIVSVFPSKSFNGQGDFIYHACNDSTLYENVETAIQKKNDTLKKAIDNANII